METKPATMSVTSSLVDSPVASSRPFSLCHYTAQRDGASFINNKWHYFPTTHGIFATNQRVRSYGRWYPGEDRVFEVPLIMVCVVIHNITGFRNAKKP